MPRIEESALTTGISKKRIIGVILITGILFASFAFSVTFFRFLFNSQRLAPNENLTIAPEEEPMLLGCGTSLGLLEQLFDAFDLPNETLEKILEEYQNMADGIPDISDLDSRMLMIAALLGSQIPVFRIYDYDNVDSVSGNLWKYNSYDEYTGSEWKSNSPLSETSFYTQSDKDTHYPTQDDLKITKEVTPDQVGAISVLLPVLFPSPFIMQGSIDVPNIDASKTRLMKNGFNSSTVILSFTSTATVNMSYRLFGANFPSVSDLAASAVNPDYTPTDLKDEYLTLSNDINTYINAHPYFEAHYNNLDAIIDDDDDAATVASKIRTYMQSNFEFGVDAMDSDPPEDGEDLIEWFCENEEGVWSDFASAYSAFARAFGIPSRYVDGYNTRNIQETKDGAGEDVIVIREMNMYNWVELYIPTSTDGSGQWVQYDICEDVAQSYDSDDDGMPDDWELENGLDPSEDDSGGDLDGDGVTNYDEYLAGTSPTSSDTDGDGWADGDEIAAGGDPTSNDTDGDLMPDGWEVEHGLDPLVDDAGADPDGDGATNYDEYLAGTHPLKTTYILFYMNNTEAGNYNEPSVVRNSTIELQAILLNETDAPISGETITFRNGTGDFIGNVTTDAFGVAIFNYEINSSFSIGPHNVTASWSDYSNSSLYILNEKTEIIKQDYYTLYTDDNKWWEGDTLVVIGNLTWENGTGISDIYVNITIRDPDNYEVVFAYNDTVITDEFGSFNGTLVIDETWPNWPSEKSETDIWVEFDPIYNGLQYVQASLKQFDE